MKSEEMTQNEMVAAAEQVTVTTCEKNLEKKMEKLENSVNSVIEENGADGLDGHDELDELDESFEELEDSFLEIELLLDELFPEEQIPFLSFHTRPHTFF